MKSVKMKALSLFVLSLISAPAVMAAQIHETREARSVSRIETRAREFCEAAGGQYDCFVETFVVTQKSSRESWPQVLTQIVRRNQYVTEASFGRLRQSDDSIFVHLERMAYFIDADFRERQIRRTYEGLEDAIQNDVIDEDGLIALAGDSEGEFDAGHMRLAIVNLATGEIVLLSTGYSE